MGRPDQRMAITARFVPAVLIRKDEEEVGRSHGRQPSEGGWRIDCDAAFEYMKRHEEIQGFCICADTVDKTSAQGDF